MDTSFLDRFNYLDKSGTLDALNKLRGENRVLDSLLNDAAMIYALRSIDDILEFVLARMLERFIPTYLLIAIEPPRGGELTQYCYANLKPSAEQLSTGAYRILADRFANAPYPLAYDDLGLAAPVREELARFSPAIVIPMCGIEGVFGITIIGCKTIGEDYSDVEWMYIDKLSRFVSIGIQNTLYHQSAITDAKTGLYNHSYFMQRFTQELAHVTRHKARAGIIMIDVDHFKDFNDSWGHIAGDEALGALAATLKRTIRAEDVAARFGGEEFCILAIECNQTSLVDMCERIRMAIMGIALPHESQTLSITASLGCCVVDCDSEAGPDEYIEMADKALYRSKRNGRNRTTLYREGLLDQASALRPATS